jgi:hypothetical protein
MSDIPQPSVNPYLVTPGGGEAILEAKVLEGAPAARPRVWTVFATLAAAFAATIVVSFIGAAGLAIALLAAGESPQELAERIVALLTSPPVFIAFGLPTQMVIAGAAIVAASPPGSRPSRWPPGWAWCGRSGRGGKR